MPVEELAEHKENFYYEQLPHLQPVPEVLEHIEAQYGKIPFAIVSGSSRESVIKSLTTIGLLDRFDVLVGSDDYANSKPAPDAYLLAAAHLGIAPKDCLVFEDTEIGIRAATAAGMASVKIASPLERRLRAIPKTIKRNRQPCSVKLLEQFGIHVDFLSALKGGSVLMKKPLKRAGSVYTNSETAVAPRREAQGYFGSDRDCRLFSPIHRRKPNRMADPLRHRRCRRASPRSSPNARYGFHRDELQFLSDARHLDWGFVSVTRPLTPFLEHIGLALFGVSLVGLRLFSVLAQSTALIATGLMARDLGGGRSRSVHRHPRRSAIPRAAFQRNRIPVHILRLPLVGAHRLLHHSPSHHRESPLVARHRRRGRPRSPHQIRHCLLHRRNPHRPCPHLRAPLFHERLVLGRHWHSPWPSSSPTSSGSFTTTSSPTPSSSTSTSAT